MADAYADAVIALEDAIHRACSRAEDEMTHEELASVLRRLAGEYERGEHS